MLLETLGWLQAPFIVQNAYSNTYANTNTHAKLEAFFKLANIPFLCKTSYYNIQKKFLFGVINEAWLNERTILISGIKKKPACSLSGDGCCDSPGHCSKYMTYSILDQASNKVIDMEICQCTQAGNLNRMEKFTFVKVSKKFVVMIFAHR